MARKNTPAPAVAIPTKPTPAASVSAKTGGSNKSMPAPAIAVPAGIRKWLWLAVVAIAVFIGIALIASIARSPEQLQVPGAATQQKEVTPLLAPANGDSPHISAPDVGYAASFTGYGFTAHCVYSDGSDKIIGDATNPCVIGPIVYWYVRDTSGRPNMITYKFVRPS